MGNCFGFFCIFRLQILVLTQESCDLGACSTGHHHLPKTEAGMRLPSEEWEMGLCSAELLQKASPMTCCQLG